MVTKYFFYYDEAVLILQSKIFCRWNDLVCDYRVSLNEMLSFKSCSKAVESRVPFMTGFIPNISLIYDSGRV